MTEEVVTEVIVPDAQRLGTLEFTHELGSVFKYTDKFFKEIYFAWPKGSGRGYECFSLLTAQAFIGLRKPTGCDDFDGEVRLGRMVERNAAGEIWKHVTGSLFTVDYYVWFVGAREARMAFNLSEARKIIDQDVTPANANKTLPKSAYAQNSKGYKAK